MRLERAAALLLAERVACVASASLVRAGVPHVVIKGVAAAHTLYRDPLDRPFSDVDLCVPSRYMHAARSALHTELTEVLAERTLCTAFFRARWPLAPSLDVQAWVGYAFVPRGGIQALSSRAVSVRTSSGSFLAADPLDEGCLGALFAVRDRLAPRTEVLLSDMTHAESLFGTEALFARAGELGLLRIVHSARKVSMARAFGAKAPYVERVFSALDARAPRLMTTLPAALLDHPIRAAASFTVTTALCGVDFLARHARTHVASREATGAEVGSSQGVSRDKARVQPRTR